MVNKVSSKMVDYLQGGTGSTTRALEDKLQDVVSVKDFGAVGDGVVDDTAAVQAALDSGASEVFFPAGTYGADQITLNTEQTITGEGYGTVLKQRVFSGDFLVNAVNTDQFITIQNLVVDGNKAAQSTTNAGINLDGGGTPTATGDHVHILDNIVILNTKGHGLAFSNGVREVKCINVHVHGADRRGFSIGATDSQFTNCTSGSAGEEGFLIGGANNRFSTCKAFSSGRLVTTSAGWNFGASGDRCVASACEAQDNNGHGFLLNTCDGVQLAGVIADSNGVTSGSGIRTDAATNCVCQFFSGNRSGKTTQTYGLDIAGATADCTFIGSFDSNVTGAVNDGGTSAPNKIVQDGVTTQIVESQTIATGVVTISNTENMMRLQVDTESAAATDDLDTISGGVDGQTIVVQTQDSARDVTLKDATGNLRLAGDFLLDTNQDSIMLHYRSTVWCEVSRSNNT